MKKIFTLMAVVCSSVLVLAQSPHKTSYQAVVRNESNSLIISQSVGVRMSIVQGSEKGNTVFSEIFDPKPKTNANGLLTLEIGGGKAVSGTFSEIDWSKGPYFIKTEIDPSGGSNYTVTGITQLLSVPFALHAKTVENDKVDDADNDPTNEIQQLSLSGTVLSLSRGGGTVELPSSGGGDNWGTQNVASDATLDGSGTSASPLKLADNAVTSNKIASRAVTGSKIAQDGASSGQVLKWDGATWIPGDDETGEGGFSLPYSGSLSTHGIAFSVENQGSGGGIRGISPTGTYGVYGVTTSSVGLAYGVIGASASSDGRGISGEASSTSGSNYGVYGRSSSNEGYGVFGWVNSTTGTNYGVSGLSSSTSGRGVYGEARSTTGNNFGVFGKTNSSLGVGVYGIAESLTGNTYSVMGENSSSTGTGVYGVARSNTGLNYGVRGTSSSSSGRGIYGEASNTTGTTYGVAGTSRSSAGHGVFGRASSTTGVNYGVYGESESSGGRAVYGVAKSSTGKTYGVFGRSQSFYGGIGVVGINTSMPTGTVYEKDPKPIGVYGEVANEFGYSGFFKGGQVYIETKLGIGDFSSHKLHVHGNASKTEGGSSWRVWSDERLKTIIGKYTKGLSDISSLNPVLFRYNENNPLRLPSDTEQAGFIAQEVQKIFPEAVSEGLSGYLEFNIDPINIAIVNAIKELKDENESLKAENESIKFRLESLERFVASTADKGN